jgi:DNA-binding transcriptional LysR family regulator
MDSSKYQPLDSRQLRAFVILAQRGSFTLAAKDLGLSQSAVSHSMKALETDLSCRLFDRMSKKVALTQAGEQLLLHADRILREMSVAREAIERLSQWGRARLRIGASTTACQYILPEVLREFQKEYPHATVLIEPGDTPQNMEMLRSHAIDLAISLEPQRDSEFEFVPLFSDELHFIIAPTHPWAQAGRADRETLPKQQYVLYSKGSVTYRLVEAYFHEQGITLNQIMQLGSMEAIKEMVKLGLGVGILAPWVAAAEISSGTLIALPLGRRRLQRTWGILHARERRLSMAEETFLKLCREMTARLATAQGAPAN